MAKKIAEKPLFALELTKKAVNQTLDTMGQQAALDMVFGLHQLCHSHNQELYGIPADPSGFPQAAKKE
jgi:enoyl-CoA hydratase